MSSNLKVFRIYIGRCCDGSMVDWGAWYWCWYDGIQSVACHEGQALAFVKRSAAANYPIPAYLIDVWDAALAAAGATTETLDS